jgi:PAS domain S-box-containing protein
VLSADVHLESAHHASERRYRLLAENVSDIIWTLRLDTMAFSYLSPPVEKVLGFTPGEVFALGLDRLIPWPFRERVYQRLAHELGREGQPGVAPDRCVTMEIQLLRKDGSYGW